MHAHRPEQHLFLWVGAHAVAARWTIKAIPCRLASRRHTVKLLDLLLALAEQGVYQLQGKWEEMLASPPAWFHTDIGVSPILPLKYQIATVESCSISNQSLENRSCQQLSYTELTQARNIYQRLQGKKNRVRRRTCSYSVLGTDFGLETQSWGFFIELGFFWFLVGWLMLFFLNSCDFVTELWHPVWENREKVVLPCGFRHHLHGCSVKATETGCIFKLMMLGYLKSKPVVYNYQLLYPSLST